MTPTASRTFAPADLEVLCRDVVRRAGASEATAQALAVATVEAEQRKRPAVGVRHLLDYVTALRDGRLNGHPSPTLTGSRPSALVADADGGPAQLAFDLFLPRLIDAAQSSGVAVLSLRNAFTTGELGFYVRRLTTAGLIGLVCGNSPALVSVYGSPGPVTGTNPLAFGVPQRSGSRAFDQASSATAWVNVRDAAERGEPIPEGWANDGDGEATTDATAALDGSLLPFGGVKGANIAIMVELLATLAGGSFSLDATGSSGSEPPRLGLFALAIDPAAFDATALDRVERHFARDDASGLESFGRPREPLTRIDIEESLLERLAEAAR